MAAGASLRSWPSRVFNPLSAPEITIAVGRVLKQAASTEDVRDEYQRSQLLSAYSITRHLAAEQADGGALPRWFRERLAGELRSAAEAEPPLGDIEARAAAIETCDEGELGAHIRDLLVALRRSQAAGALLESVHRLLREACDRELEILAAPPE
jgi:hypothetical protein